jgi:hypothetical protein
LPEMRSPSCGFVLPSHGDAGLTIRSLLAAEV